MNLEIKESFDLFRCPKGFGWGLQLFRSGNGVILCPGNYDGFHVPKAFNFPTSISGIGIKDSN